MTANEITAKLLVAIPAAIPTCRVWRRNTGGGYPVAAIKSVVRMLRAGQVTEAIVFLARTRIVLFGMPGEPDIDGIAGPHGRRIGIEVKAAGDNQSAEQKVCQEVWECHGAIYLTCPGR